MGEEAAGRAFEFRITGMIGGFLSVILAVLGAVAMMAKVFLLAYVVYGLALLVGVPLIFYSIRPLHKALTIIRERHGISAKARMPWSVLNRAEAFDRWILENGNRNQK